MKKVLENSIGKMVKICYDNENSRPVITGVLDSIIPAEKSEYEVETLFIKKEDTEVLVPVDKLLQFYSVEDLKNAKTEYYYITFVYPEPYCSGIWQDSNMVKKHIYMSYDYTINIGDRVWVADSDEAGVVIHTGFYTKESAPFPLGKIWLIKSKSK